VRLIIATEMERIVRGLRIIAKILSRLAGASPSTAIFMVNRLTGTLAGLRESRVWYEHTPTVRWSDLRVIPATRRQLPSTKRERHQPPTTNHRHLPVLAVDNTMLVALGTMAAAQTQGTINTMDAAVRLLNYAATHPDAAVTFQKTDIILYIHSDASYLSEPKARSRVGGYFLVGRPCE
jgi:hypothetical protein